MRTDTERLNFLDKHVDGLDSGGYGADDKWFEIIYCDGNRKEGSDLRQLIDECMEGLIL